MSKATPCAPAPPLPTWPDDAPVRPIGRVPAGPLVIRASNGQALALDAGKLTRGRMRALFGRDTTWLAEAFPSRSRKGFDYLRASEALVVACHKAGHAEYPAKHSLT